MIRRTRIDTWNTHWRRLQEEPDYLSRWCQVVSRCDEKRIAEAISLAEETIDLKQIAAGPADEIGLRPDWAEHQSLDFVLQELREYPSHGSKLIFANLRSPVVRNRNISVAALAAQGQDHWNDSQRAALEAASKTKPINDVRECMERVLKGEPLED